MHQIYAVQNEAMRPPEESCVFMWRKKKKKARSNPTESVVFLGLGLSEAAISEN